MIDFEKEEREIKKLEEKLLQQQHQYIREKNRMLSVCKRQRKERTHRLIVEGAELEFIFDGIQQLPTERFRSFMQELGRLPAAMLLYQKHMAHLRSTEPVDRKEE